MKRLVICFDGTWNSADAERADTNVALLARAIHATVGTGGIPQSVLYLRGVGTAGLQAEIIFEGATGLGVDENIRSGYMFIAQNYLPGDEIFLFGFSRGAFTARSLSGLINACGVLKRQELGDLGRAWKYYRSPGPHSPADFMKSCQSDCHLGAEIKFLGVWDTVGALGVPGELFSSFDHEKYGFHDTGPCNIVKHGCHALAVDESSREPDLLDDLRVACRCSRPERAWRQPSAKSVGRLLMAPPRPPPPAQPQQLHYLVVYHNMNHTNGGLAIKETFNRFAEQNFDRQPGCDGLQINFAAD